MLRLLKFSLGVLVAVLLVTFFTLYFMFGMNIYEPPEARSSLFVRGGQLFRGVDARVENNPGMLIVDGRIICLGNLCEPRPDSRVIDATGLSIVPGLIELHGHFAAITADNADLKLTRLAWNMVRMRPDVRRRLHESGVTSFRSVGDPRDFIRELKAYLEGGELSGPRLFAAGPIFTAPGGHPTREGRDPNPSGFGGNMAFQSDDPEVIRAEVALLAEQGGDGIKAVFHGAASESGTTLLPTLSEESLRTLVDEAHAHDMWVAVHVGPLDETKTAIRAGADTIEHGVRAGNLVDAETLRLLVDNEVVYVPTLGREPMGYLNIPLLYEAGVTIGVGTDTNNPAMRYGDSYHQELQALVNAGMPDVEVLLAATRNGAKALGMEDTLGTLEAGHLADLLLVQGAPWNDIAELRNIRMVIQNGLVVMDRE